jgi:hypothetical protein
MYIVQENQRKTKTSDKTISPIKKIDRKLKIPPSISNTNNYRFFGFGRYGSKF